MRDIFLGPIRFWLLWIVVLGALYFAGSSQLQVTAYSLFLALLGGLALLCVVFVVLTARTDERITREPIEDD